MQIKFGNHQPRQEGRTEEHVELEQRTKCRAEEAVAEPGTEAEQPDRAMLDPAVVVEPAERVDESVVELTTELVVEPAGELLRARAMATISHLSRRVAATNVVSRDICVATVPPSLTRRHASVTPCFLSERRYVMSQYEDTP
jgi:hypothetical protein